MSSEVTAKLSDEVDAQLPKLERLNTKNLSQTVEAEQVAHAAHSVSRGLDSRVQRLLNRCGLVDRAFSTALYVAFPSALLALFVRVLASERLLPWLDPDNDKRIHFDTAAWTGIVSVLGFLIVFRASQAYGRYWTALSSAQLMRAEWYDAASALSAFCSNSKDPAMRMQVRIFKHTLIRLLSLYHSTAISVLCHGEDSNDDDDLDLKLIDPGGIHGDHMDAYRKSQHKVELVSQWIQCLIVRNIEIKVLTAAPPLVSRIFQELANGQVRYHDALKIKLMPFPYQYQQVCDILLGLHWIITPLIMSLWVNSPGLSFLFTFIVVFLLWSLRGLASSLESPFETQAFIDNAAVMQGEFNGQLLTLLDPTVTVAPRLCDRYLTSLVVPNQLDGSTADHHTLNICCEKIQDIGNDLAAVAACPLRSRATSSCSGSAPDQSVPAVDARNVASLASNLDSELQGTWTDLTVLTKEPSRISRGYGQGAQPSVALHAPLGGESASHISLDVEMQLQRPSSSGAACQSSRLEQIEKIHSSGTVGV